MDDPELAWDPIIPPAAPPASTNRGLDGALLPRRGIPALMMDSDDDDDARCDAEEDGVGKAAHHALPELPIDLREGLRTLSDGSDRAIDGTRKVLP